MRGVGLVVLGLAALLSGCGSGGGGSAINPNTYSVSLLQTAKTQSSSEAWFVDNSGRVIGIVHSDDGSSSLCSWLPGDNRPTLLNIPGEAFTSITLRAQTIGFRQRISNQDRIVYIGQSAAGVVDLLTGATVTLLNLPGTTFSVPSDVNDAGVSVGTCYQDASLVNPALPVMWSAMGEPTQLTLPPGCDCAVANAINNSGQITGKAWSINFAVPPHAVVWNADGSVLDETPLTPEQVSVGAEGLLISDNGYIVVGSPQIGPTRFDLVSPTGGVTHLIDPQSPFGVSVQAINALGQVAGNGGSGQPVVWNPDGSMIELPLPYPTMCMVRDINDDGVVVGQADSQNSIGRVALEWTPSP